MTTTQNEPITRVPVMSHRDLTNLPVGTVVQFRNTITMRRRKTAPNTWTAIQPYQGTSGVAATDPWEDTRFAVGTDEWHVIADPEVAAQALDRLPVGTTIQHHQQLHDLPDGTRLVWEQRHDDTYHFVKQGASIAGLDRTFEHDSRVIEAWNPSIFTIESYPDGEPAAPVLDTLPVGTRMTGAEMVQSLPIGSRLQGGTHTSPEANFFEKTGEDQWQHNPDGTGVTQTTYDSSQVSSDWWHLVRYGSGEPPFRVGQLLNGDQMTAETVNPAMPVGSRVTNSRGITFQRLPEGWFRYEGGVRGRPMTPNGNRYTVTHVGPTYVVGQALEKTVEVLNALPVGSMVAYTVPADDDPLSGYPSGSGGWVKRETDWVQNTGGSLEGGPEAVLRSFGSRDMLLRHVGVASSTGQPALSDAPASTETLRQFKQRFRTIALGRMYRNGIEQGPVNRLLGQLGIDEEPMTPGVWIDPDHAAYDTGSLVTGMVVQREDGAVFGWNGTAWLTLVGGPGQSFRDHDRQACKVTYVPGAVAPEWTSTVVTGDDSRQVWEFKRTLRESGDRLRSQHSYCGEYGRAMSDAGVPEAHEFRR